MGAIFKREVAAYFKSVVAYCIIAFFGVFNGLYFWNINIANQSISYGTTLASLTSFFAFFIPVITMKLFADEKKNGTEVLLKTTAVRTSSIVLGKYFAACVVFLVMTAQTIVCPIIIYGLLSDKSAFPFAKTIGAYVGFILLGLAYLAIGLFASSLTESQPVAAVIGIIIIVAISFLETIGSKIGGVFGSILKWLALPSRTANFEAGVLDIPSILFLLIFAGIMLFVTTMVIERRRWN